MPTLVNGKTKSNIIRDMPRHIRNIIESDSGTGLISGSRYHDRNKDKNIYTFYDMSNASVVPDAKGDDLYMVNYHNGMSYSEFTDDCLYDGVMDYLYEAIDMQKSSKATVRIVRNSQGRYEVDNMRIYETLSEARREGYNNMSEHAVSVATGKHFPL